MAGKTIRFIWRVLLTTAVVAGLFFLPAGRLDWPEAWLFLFAFLGFLLLYYVWAHRRDPAQLQERKKPGPNVKSWDKVIMALYTGLLLLLFPVCALDAVRFHWSGVSAAMECLGWLGLACAGGIILRAAATNTFLSSTARIQDDRGQTVVAAGPYRFVRHPMYLGIIVLFLGIPVALGSFWGLIPGAAIGILFLLRTALEDRMLQKELPGYAAYAARVKFRLVPGVW
jgi:protein-S-isoprenylcysteine O-methyltransferase Ste14